ncbi:hypothetical protein MCERH10_01282 [Caulobacteraceae bacterium]
MFIHSGGDDGFTPDCHGSLLATHHIAGDPRHPLDQHGVIWVAEFLDQIILGPAIGRSSVFPIFPTFS